MLHVARIFKCSITIKYFSDYPFSVKGQITRHNQPACGQYVQVQVEFALNPSTFHSNIRMTFIACRNSEKSKKQNKTVLKHHLLSRGEH